MPAVTCAEISRDRRRLTVAVKDYDLAATLTSGQAFRWIAVDRGWESVIGARWVRLTSLRGAISVEVATAVDDWSWIENYLGLEADMEAVVAAFPDDASLRRAVRACRGLRLLRQDPWEGLASFILSSTKRIQQIQQIVSLLCQRWGAPVAVPPGRSVAYSFPSPARLARCSEAELRACKMGFRAPYLLEAAKRCDRGELNLSGMASLGLEEAREHLMRLPGVGEKIANCALLFGLGFQRAFPIDVWIEKALSELYFPTEKPSAAKLRSFAHEYFGPHAGYAQQYLFHYMRVASKPLKPDRGG